MNTKFVLQCLICSAVFMQTSAKSTTSSKAHQSTTSQTSLVKDITSGKELQQIIEKNNLVIADFYSPTCPHCKNMEPLFKELARLHKDITFVKVNAIDHKPLRKEYNVSSMPTFIFFKKGKPFSSNVGEAQKSEFEQEIAKLKQ